MSVPVGAGGTGEGPHHPDTPDPRRLSLNTATVKLRWDLARMIEGCARHGIRGIAPWRDKLAELGVAEAARRIRAADLTVTGLCRGGMFPAADDAGRRAAIDDTRRAVDDAATLGAQCLVLVVGGLPAGSKDLQGARAQVHDGIAAVLPHARAAGVPLAIEPLHPMYAADRACVNTLAQALDLCDALDPGGPGVHARRAIDGMPWAQASALGVAVDAYHVWWDPELDAQIRRAGAARLHAFHVCDWLVPTRDLLEDRGMMGDGVIDLRGLRRKVEAAGFRGLHECEIFSSRDWWQRDPDEVLDVMKARHAAHC
ncbi:MAG: sugar phosphate isomerase/epimerase [Burkholderiales bacterium]|nr:MAG: sugar phosphate isomerase/epimerase [Burkholderiales bacterium]